MVRGQTHSGWGLVLWTAVVSLCLWASGSQARDVTAISQEVFNQPTLVIYRDHGGPVVDRAMDIQRMMSRRQPVQIRGICHSACTMYLALPDTCVFPTAVLGFHGPFNGVTGEALDPDVFEIISRMMANHYPPRLREWFLETGRHRFDGHWEIAGADLTRFDVPLCPAS